MSEEWHEFVEGVLANVLVKTSVIPLENCPIVPYSRHRTGLVDGTPFSHPHPLPVQAYAHLMRLRPSTDQDEGLEGQLLLKWCKTDVGLQRTTMLRTLRQLCVFNLDQQEDFKLLAFEIYCAVMLKGGAVSANVFNSANEPAASPAPSTADLNDRQQLQSLLGRLLDGPPPTEFLAPGAAHLGDWYPVADHWRRRLPAHVLNAYVQTAEHAKAIPECVEWAAVCRRWLVGNSRALLAINAAIEAQFQEHSSLNPIRQWVRPAVDAIHAEADSRKKRSVEVKRMLMQRVPIGRRRIRIERGIRSFIENYWNDDVARLKRTSAKRTEKWPAATEDWLRRIERSGQLADAQAEALGRLGQQSSLPRDKNRVRVEVAELLNRPLFRASAFESAIARAFRQTTGPGAPDVKGFLKGTVTSAGSKAGASDQCDDVCAPFRAIPSEESWLQATRERVAEITGVPGDRHAMLLTALFLHVVLGGLGIRIRETRQPTDMQVKFGGPCIKLLQSLQEAVPGAVAQTISGQLLKVLGMTQKSLEEELGLEDLPANLSPWFPSPDPGDDELDRLLSQLPEGHSSATDVRITYVVALQVLDAMLSVLFIADPDMQDMLPSTFSQYVHFRAKEADLPMSKRTFQFFRSMDQKTQLRAGYRLALEAAMNDVGPYVWAASSANPGGGHAPA